MENFISCAMIVDLTSFSISENKKEESGACGMAMYSKYQKPKIEVDVSIIAPSSKLLILTKNTIKLNTNRDEINPC